jgi:cation/acetate symporter
VASILTGSFLAVGLIVISPTVWGDVFGHKGPDGKPIGLIALKNPAIISMTAAFVVAWAVSLLTKEQTAEDAFEDEKLRTYLGIGAE